MSFLRSYAFLSFLRFLRFPRGSTRAREGIPPGGILKRVDELASGLPPTRFFVGLARYLAQKPSESRAESCGRNHRIDGSNASRMGYTPGFSGHPWRIRPPGAWPNHGSLSRTGAKKTRLPAQ